MPVWGMPWLFPGDAWPPVAWEAGGLRHVPLGGGAWAEGLGRRAVARGLEGAPHTGLHGLGAAAAQLQAFSQDCRPAGRGTPGQLDARCARLRAVTAGRGSEAEALARLSRAPQGVGGAMAPVTTWRLPSDGGDRTLALAQSVLQQVVEGLAPGGMPLDLTAGCQA
jgi:hypothetical protein